jgi:hypothetical protein
MYNLDDLIEYEPKFLAGQQAQAYDLSLDNAWEQARHTMREETRKECRKQTSTNKVRNFSMSLDFSDESWRYILLPVYIAIYHYRGESFQVMVNGQTGKISGQRPADWLKVWLVVLAIMSPSLIAGLVGIILLLLSDVGFPVLVIAFILASLGVLLSYNLIKKAQRLDDV